MTHKFVEVQNGSTQHNVLSNRGAKHLCGDWYLNGELVGYREEIDRDEDRIYYSFWIREDLL